MSGRLEGSKAIRIELVRTDKTTLAAVATDSGVSSNVRLNSSSIVSIIRRFRDVANERPRRIRCTQVVDGMGLRSKMGVSI